MKRMAHIEAGMVVNVSLWDGVSDWQPDGEVVELPEGSPAGIGWSYEAGEFIAPPPAPDEDE